MKTFVQKSFAELFDERGNYIPDDRYREILRLDALLAAQGVPHTCLHLLDGWQVCLPGPGPACRMDAIENFGSYGAGEDRLELLDRDGEKELKELYEYNNPRLFCYHCGRPMTDEAVEMVMERLEALYEHNA